MNEPGGSVGSLTIRLTPQGSYVGVDLFVVTTAPRSISIGVPVRVATTTLLDLRSIDLMIDGAIVADAEKSVTQLPGLGELVAVTAEASSHTPVHVRYQAPIISAISSRKRGPAYDLRGTDNGFAAALLGFVTLPWLDEGVWDVSLEWSLEQGMTGESTRGLGNCRWVATTFDTACVFVAGGSLSRWDDGRGFSASWFEAQEYDTQEAFAFAASVLAGLRRVFEDGAPQRDYHLIIRPSSIYRDGGAATTSGFMLESGLNQPTRLGRMFMFAHEIAHHFTSSLTGDLSTIAWYSEGLAEFYKVEIPRRLGLCTPSELAGEITTMTQAYAANFANAKSVLEIAGGHWGDGWVQMLPYNRGFHYFAGLDFMLREGPTQIDDLVREVNRRRSRGEVANNAMWRTMLEDLGDPALVRHFDSMMAGAILRLDDDTFGASLRPRRIDLERRSIGFNDMTLTPLPSAISGVAPGSSAEQAGLLDGDIVVSYEGVEHSRLHSSTSLLLNDRVKITVLRGGTEQVFEYETVVDTVDAWVWEAV